MGFVQNLLANGLRLQAISSELQRLADEEAETGVPNGYKLWYYYGIIANMLLIFDPVTEDLVRLFSTDENLPFVRRSEGTGS